MSSSSWSWRTPPPPPPPPPTLYAAALDHPKLLACLVVAISILMLVLNVRSRKLQKPPLARTATVYSRAKNAASAPVGLTPKQLTDMLRRVPLLNALGDPEIAAAVQSLKTQTFKAGEVIYRQDDEGKECYFMVSGECHGVKKLHTFHVDIRVTHKRHGVGTVSEVSLDPNITKVEFDKGESHGYGPASMHKLKPLEPVTPRVVEDLRFGPGDHFGERGLRKVELEPRPATITCTTDVTVLYLTMSTFMVYLTASHRISPHLDASRRVSPRLAASRRVSPHLALSWTPLSPSLHDLCFGTHLGLPSSPPRADVYGLGLTSGSPPHHPVLTCMVWDSPRAPLLTTPC